jgi:hypothetical protein
MIVWEEEVQGVYRKVGGCGCTRRLCVCGTHKYAFEAFTYIKQDHVCCKKRSVCTQNSAILILIFLDSLFHIQCFMFYILYNV